MMKTTKINKFKMFFFALALLNISCHDEDALYEYQVVNSTNFEIKVDVLATLNAFTDTTYTIGAQQSKIIYYTSHGVEGSGAPYFQDVAVDLQTIKIRKNDTIVSNRDYRQNNNWQYSGAFYKATVTEEEFQ